MRRETVGREVQNLSAPANCISPMCRMQRRSIVSRATAQSSPGYLRYIGAFGAATGSSGAQRRYESWANARKPLVMIGPEGWVEGAVISAAFSAFPAL